MNELYRGFEIHFCENVDDSTEKEYRHWYEVDGQVFNTLEEAQLFIDTVLIH